MSRLLPKSLFGQTLLILLGGLILSHAVGSWIYTMDREQAVRAVGGFAAAQRIANLTRLVQETPPERRERMVAALSDQSFRVSVSAQPPATTSGDDDAPVELAIKDFLVDRLSLAPARQPRVSAAGSDGPAFGGWHPMMGRGPMMHGFGPLAASEICRLRSLCRMVSGSRLRPPCRGAAPHSRVSSSCRWESWQSSFWACPSGRYAA